MLRMVLNRFFLLLVKLSLMYSCGFNFMQAPMRSCLRVLFMSLTITGQFRCCFCRKSLCAILMSDSFMFNCRWFLTAFVTTLAVDSLFISCGTDGPLMITMSRRSYWSTLSSFVARSFTKSLRFVTLFLRCSISLSFSFSSCLRLESFFG